MEIGQKVKWLKKRRLNALFFHKKLDKCLLWNLEIAIAMAIYLLEMGWVEQKMKLYKAFLNLFLKVQKSSKMNQNLAKKSLWFNPSKLKNPKIFENLMHHYTTYIGSVYIGKNYISLEKIREIWNKSISQFFFDK